MFRFFVDHKIDNHFILSKENLNHIKVARIDKEFICIYKGEFYLTELKGDVALIKEKIDENHEHEGEVIVAAGIMNMKRFEWLIQKAAELGATKIIPFTSSRTSVKLPTNIDKKLQRWNQIALNASEQSFRNKALVVEKISTFEEVLKVDIKNKYLAYENHDEKEGFYKSDSLFITGPEGGFSDQEVKLAKENGVKIVSLGKRILRAETAPLFMLSRIK